MPHLHDNGRFGEPIQLCLYVQIEIRPSSLALTNKTIAIFSLRSGGRDIIGIDVRNAVIYVEITTDYCVVTIFMLFSYMRNTAWIIENGLLANMIFGYISLSL